MSDNALIEPGCRPAALPAGLAAVTHGTRGSHPVDGPAFTAYGGRTSCVGILSDGLHLLVDAGTGLIAHGRTLAAAAGDRFDILLTHLHHDHIQGLPFFAPAFVPGVEIHVHGGHVDGTSPERALRRAFAPPFFPVPFEAFAARFVFHGRRAGVPFRLGGLDIGTCELPHPGGATGYRFDRGGRSLAVITDLELTLDDRPDALVAFARDCDLAMIDTMVPQADYPRFRGFGHGTAEAALAFADRARIGAVVGTHHAPWLGDAELSAISARMERARAGSGLARDGRILSGG